MRGQRFAIAMAVMLVARALPAFGADRPSGVDVSARAPAAQAPAQASDATDVRALVERIDQAIAAKWEATKTQPAAPADDAEFLRRVSLDLIGRIPTAAEARAFLDDPSADKRARLVETLLASPGYVSHQTNIWRGLLLPEESANFQVQYFGLTFRPWLVQKFTENAGYDQMVRELITAQVGQASNRFVNPFSETKPSTYAYYAAKDGKPENLAGGAARLFLGVRLECAQCHDHPFAKWKRDQFWGLAAFFADIDRRSEGDAFFQARELTDRRELNVPGTERVVQASFLDGTEPQWKARVGARTTLAEWITSPSNPYFARAAVNRVWAQFFGVGIVEPVDDMGPENAPSHPELLDELARQFAAHHFDFKFLIRAITASRAYQLSSAGYAPGQDDVRLFARMPIRGLSAQQLYASLLLAAGLRGEGDQPPFFFGGDSPRKDFLDRFSSQDEKPTEHQTSILQALTLMNGRLMADGTSLNRGGTLPAVADSYFLSTPEKIEALYLAALARRPRPEELERLVAYVDRGGRTLNPKQALADVFWALLNSAEFILNH